MTNKQIATEFLKTLCANKVQEAYDKFTSKDFIHHNQWFKGDRESLLNGMKEAHSQFPNTTIDIKFVLEEGDLVATHSLVKHEPDHAGVVVVHMSRIKNGKIVEFWDVVMPVETESPNENGCF